MVDAIVHCLDTPAGLRNSFSQLLGGVVVNPIAKFPEVQWLPFAQYHFLRTALRMLFPRAYLGELPLWKSPSQAVSWGPWAKTLFICTQQGHWSWRVRQLRLELEAFEWASALLVLSLPPSHGQCDSSCSPSGRWREENDREWASLSSFLPQPVVSHLSGSSFLRVSSCQTRSQCVFIWHGYWHLYMHTCTHTHI